MLKDVRILINYYYIFSAWGNLLSNVMNDAVLKAIESDVEFRRGLPINYNSYMGLGMVRIYFIYFHSTHITFMLFLFFQAFSNMSRSLASDL